MAKLWRKVAAVAAVLPLIAACTDASGGSTTEPTTSDERYQNGLVGVTPSDAVPEQGGELAMAVYSPVQSLDPAVGSPAGSTGGSELAAIYDVLVRFDQASGEYQPQLAEELTPHDEHSRWTLRLRPDVDFSDGRPLDAAAVVASIERYLEVGGGKTAVWKENVVSTEASGEHTVTFTLKDSWPGFPYLLSTPPGMIVPQDSGTGADFQPIGAGPFSVAHFRTGEELLLQANNGYWAGRPHLDEVRFFYVSGGPATFDVLRTGQADVAFLRHPASVAAARDEGFGGDMTLVNLGSALMFNNRDGSPFADPRVRQAAAYAIDTELFNERVHDGEALAGRELFRTTSSWANSVDPAPHDPEKAAELLAEAKADGFDGEIRFLGTRSMEDIGLAVKAQLEAVGFEVTLDNVPAAGEIVDRVFVQRDFDFSIWGFGASDESAYSKLYERFHSTSAANPMGYANNEMDELINEMRTADTSEKQADLGAQLQELWNRDMPAMVLLTQVEFITWGNHVHGVTPTSEQTVLFHEAWKEK